MFSTFPHKLAIESPSKLLNFYLSITTANTMSQLTHRRKETAVGLFRNADNKYYKINLLKKKN